MSDLFTEETNEHMQTIVLASHSIARELQELVKEAQRDNNDQSALASAQAALDEYRNALGKCGFKLDFDWIEQLRDREPLVPSTIKL
ncbi:hypothetical protein TDB9533_01267 [Thalassocella blandensis]|nr:hypothetical protein TDB9533_01267 [Thalassocella blandensis]